MLRPVQAVPDGRLPGQYGVQVHAELIQRHLAARGEPVAEVTARGGQPVRPRPFRVMPPVPAGQQALVQQPVEQSDPESADQVVVAGAGLPQGAGVGALAQ
jgi:hypothetical protein